jgi:hypothetical protein
VVEVLHRLALVLFVSALAACKNDDDESDAGSGGGSGASTTGGCVGDLGCECKADNTCNAGFECLFPGRECVEEDCVPGSPLCNCDSLMMCVEGYECIANVCEPIGGSSSSSATGTGTDTGTGADTTAAGTTG